MGSTPKYATKNEKRQDHLVGKDEANEGSIFFYQIMSKISSKGCSLLDKEARGWMYIWKNSYHFVSNLACNDLAETQE